MCQSSRRLKMLQSTCHTAPSATECARSCARTLSCGFWRVFAHECCLGREALEEQREGPPHSSRRSEHGKVLHPCEHGCLAFGQASIANVSVDDVPWLRVLHQLRPREAPPAVVASSAGARAEGVGRSPRVAVCLAGQARSLVEPAVWHSIRDLLLERGRHALFMVLTLTLTLTSSS